MQLHTIDQARAYLTGTILKLYPTHAGEEDTITARICEALHAVRTLGDIVVEDIETGKVSWAYESVLFDGYGDSTTDPVLMLLREDGEIS